MAFRYPTPFREAARCRHCAGLWLGGAAAGVVWLFQAYFAWWFASSSPPWLSAAVHILLGVILALAAPAAGMVAWFRSGRTCRSLSERIGAVEYVVGAGGLILPTLLLVAVSAY
jgi:hypothetical protein